MFSRWGAFVYRFRRPVALMAVVVAVVLGVFGLAGVEPPELRRLARHARPSRPPSTRPSPASSASGGSSLIVLFRSTASTDATSPGLPGGDRLDARRRSTSDPDVAGVVGYAETGDRAVHQHRRHARPTRRPAQRHRRAVGRPRRRAPGEDRPAGRLHDPAHRLRAADEGLGGPVREGPPARRDRVAAVRRAHPRVRLRLDRRGRDADRSSPRLAIPSTLGLIFFVEPAGRDEHLRPEHRDDARAGPRRSTTRCSS